MQKFTVVIDGTSKVFDLQESLTYDNPYILLRKVTIFLDYNNIDDTNEELTYNSVKRSFSESYWTFGLIKDVESYGNITLELNKYDRSCTLTSDLSINLKNVCLIFSIYKR